MARRHRERCRWRLTISGAITWVELLSVTARPLLRANSPGEHSMKLNCWKMSWPLDAEKCPCDIHFFDYCRTYGICDKSVFHFGTGQHHYVGIRNMELRPPNEILGVTASREEYSSYIDLIVDNPLIANYYKVLFCDIYTMRPRSTPSFDLVTLFHLCEFYSANNRAYTDGDDLSILTMFIAKLHPGGQLLFYCGSKNFAAAEVLVDRKVSEGILRKQTEFKTIVAYEKCASS
jgi:hypothetical protein